MALELSAMANGATILSYIDTAISIATFFMSEKIPVTIDNIRSYFGRRDQEIPAYFDIEDANNLIQNLIIHPEILEVLQFKVKDALTIYKQCLLKAKKQQENHACDVRAEREVCDILNRILDRNNNKLPSKILQNHWVSFGCVRF